jgi:putative aldouronate transport system substrate-binding protein
MKRHVYIILALALTTTMVLGGCGQKQQTGSDKNDPKKEDKITSFKKYDPPITITTPMIQGKEEDFPAGDSVENHAFLRWAEKEMGIIWKAKWIAPDHESNFQKLSLALVSGDMPDVVYAPIKEIAKLTNGKVLQPLDDVIDKYSSPLVKFMIDEHQQATGNSFYLSYMFGGKIHAFPHAADIMAAWSSNWIRKDILDELGKPVPSTLAEMEEILAAYKAKNPNAIGHVLDKDLGGIDTVMQAFSVHPKRWVQTGDGKLEYGSIQPGVRQGLEVLSRWYKNGWLDKEFIVKDFSKATEPLVAGNGLSMRGAWWNVWWPLPNLWKNVEKAEIAPVPPLKGPDGKSQVMLTPGYGWGTAISTSFKHPEALAYQLNEMVDSFYRNNSELRQVLKDKHNYEFKYPVTKLQEPINPDEKNLNRRKYAYEVPGFGFFNDGPSHMNFAHGFKWAQRSTELFDLYMDINKASKENKLGELSGLHKIEYTNLMEIPKRFETHMKSISTIDSLNKEQGTVVYNRFIGAPTKTMQEKGAYLDKLEMETFAKIIMGELGIDAFDKFVEDWKKAGGENIIAEVNEWYQGTKK